MNASFRSLFSASLGPGLTVFTVCSAWFSGPLAIVTILGFAFTVVYGVVEIALLAYTPAARIDLEGTSSAATADAAPSTSFKLGPAPDRIVSFPSATDEETARAA